MGVTGWSDAIKPRNHASDIAGVSIYNDDPGGIGYPSFTIANGATQVVPPGQAATVTVAENGNAVAGIDIPAGTFAQEVTVSVRFVPIQPGDPCHGTLLGQVGRCLEISARQADGTEPILQQNATAGLCLDSDRHLELFRFEDAQSRPVALRQTGAAFLHCDGFVVGSAAPRNRLEGLAMSVAKQVGNWISPKPLYAAHNGFGGVLGIGGPCCSRFRWASPLQISNAGVLVNVLRSGKDAVAVRGMFTLGTSGFTALTDDIAVGVGKSLFTIPANTFRYSPLTRQWVYAAQTSVGVTAMAINAVDGTFTLAATVPTEGALPNFKPLSIRIGNRTQGAGLVCVSTSLCTGQEASNPNP